MVGDTANKARQFAPQGQTLSIIGGSVSASLDEINKGFLRAAENEGQVPVKRYPITGQNFNCDAIWRAVQDVKRALDRNDAVVFYYAGHGFRTEETPTKFPYFICGPASKLGPSEIAAALETPKDRKPRLIIVVADTCNSALGARGTPEFPKIIPPNRCRVKDGVQRLFGTAEGRLIISAAQKGDRAWFDSHYTIDGAKGLYIPGGMFTDLLQNSVDSALLKGSAATWSEIITSATRTMVVDVIGYDPIDTVDQTPISSGSDGVILKDVPTPEQTCIGSPE
jgi:hypothetical protein